MIALDTNVLVRYLVRDDPRQTAAATRLIEAECHPGTPGAISLIVLCELVWVLTRGYRYRRPLVAAVLRKLFVAEDLEIERADLAWQALNLYEEGPADMADYLIGLSGRGQGADVTWTFDTEAASCPLFRKLQA